MRQNFANASPEHLSFICCVDQVSILFVSITMSFTILMPIFYPIFSKSIPTKEHFHSVFLKCWVDRLVEAHSQTVLSL